MTYDEASAAHAAGHNVTCGLGLRPALARWNTTLDLARERTSTDWVVVSWSDFKRARPSKARPHPDYERVPGAWRYRLRAP